MVKLLLQYKLFTFAILLVFFVLLLSFFIQPSSQPSQPQVPPKGAIPTPMPLLDPGGNIRRVISPLQKTVIGTTTEQEVSQTFGTDQKEILPNNHVKYASQSAVNLLPEEAITKQGVVVFERIMLPKDPAATGALSLSYVTSSLGKPDEIIQGSKTYGTFIKTYIYAGKGVAVVANDTGDIVYELHKFSPTTLTLYKTTYGSDLDPGAQPEGEQLVR